MIRKAFTLVELLVVIAIIMLLMALILPAIQKVRAAADKLVCSNNLKQIGISLHAFHSDHNRLPAGRTSQKPGETTPNMTWLTRILPYIEQDILWSQTLTAYGNSSNPFLAPPHSGFQKVIKLFSCPSDERVQSSQSTDKGYIVGLTSYLGVLGKDYTTNDGVLIRDGKIKLTDIYDGTSNTIMVGERPPSPDFWYGWWYAGVGQKGTGSLDMLLGAAERNAQEGKVAIYGLGPYKYKRGDVKRYQDVFHFWSLHPNGSLFLAADASVHFITYEIELGLLDMLATRNGGEAISLPD